MRHENFNDVEALKIAINIEEEGLEFYATLVRTTKDSKVKEVFSRLAVSEKEHINRFQKIYSEIPSSPSTAQGAEDATMDLYLKYLVDTGIFSQKGEARKLAAEIKSDREALKIGIQAEKDSILYYSEAAKSTKYDSGKKVFELLINEEKEHLKLLAEQLKALKG